MRAGRFERCCTLFAGGSEETSSTHSRGMAVHPRFPRSLIAVAMGYRACVRAILDRPYSVASIAAEGTRELGRVYPGRHPSLALPVEGRGPED